MNRHIPTLLAGYLLLLLLGCGASRETLDAASEGSQATALPALSQLDKLPQPKSAGPRSSVRSASAVDTANWDCEPLLKSTHVEPDLIGFKMLASGEKLEYVVQRTDVAGLRLKKLTVQMSIWSGQGYCAFANFATGQWEIQLVEEGTPPALTENLDDYRSPAGYYYFAILAYNGSYLQCYGFRSETEPGDPVVTDVTSLGNNATDTRLVDYHGKPVIFFRDTLDDKLKAAWTNAATPSQPADWKIYDVSDAYPGYRPFDATVHNGKLHVVYGAPNYQLRIAVLEGDPAAGVSAWTKHVADNGMTDDSQDRYCPSLLSLNGKLHLVHVHWDNQDFDGDGTHSRILYTEFDDSYSGQTYVLAKTIPKDLPKPSLTAVNGRPAVAWSDGSAGGLWYAGAWNADPKMGEWDITQPTSDGADESEVKLLEIDGCPSILHLRPSTLEFCVSRCSVPNPVDSSTWEFYDWGFRATQGELAATVSHRYASYMFPDYEGTGARLAFRRAYRQAQNPAEYPWHTYAQADETDDTFYSLHMTTVNGEPAASLLRSGQGGTTLQYMQLAFPE